MVGPIGPTQRTLRAIQWHPKAAALFGTFAAETILASGVTPAPTGRTHGRKRSDPNIRTPLPCKQEAVHTWIATSLRSSQ